MHRIPQGKICSPFPMYVYTYTDTYRTLHMFSTKHYLQLHNPPDFAAKSDT